MNGGKSKGTGRRCVVVGAGRAHFRYDDLCRLVDLLTRLAERLGPSES